VNFKKLFLLFPLFFLSCEPPHTNSKEKIAICNAQIERNDTFSEVIFCPELSGIRIDATIPFGGIMKLTILGTTLGEPITNSSLVNISPAVDTNLSIYYITFSNGVAIGTVGTVFIRRGDEVYYEDINLTLEVVE
jgi:hypothetical protein